MVSGIFSLPLLFLAGCVTGSGTFPEDPEPVTSGSSPPPVEVETAEPFVPDKPGEKDTSATEPDEDERTRRITLLVF